MVSRPGLTRTAIVEDAGKLADEIGLEKLTLSGVASRLGVRTPSLYNHIDGLDGLRRELSVFGIRELDRRLQRAALGKATDDALASMLYAYRAFAKERPGVYAATLRAPQPGDSQVQAASQAIVDTVLTVLAAYALSPEDAIHGVRGFRALGHGFTSLEASGAFGMALDTEDSYQKLITTFLRGLGALEKTGGK